MGSGEGRENWAVVGQCRTIIMAMAGVEVIDEATLLAQQTRCSSLPKKVLVEVAVVICLDKPEGKGRSGDMIVERGP